MTNTGDRAGEEVVQVCIRDLVGSVTRPVQELKGYRKLALERRESRTVSFTIASTELAFTRADMSYGWEAGEFELWIAPSSGKDAGRSVRFSIE